MTIENELAELISNGSGDIYFHSRRLDELVDYLHSIGGRFSSKTEDDVRAELIAGKVRFVGRLIHIVFEQPAA